MAQLIRDKMLIFIKEGAEQHLNCSNPDLDMWDVTLADADDLRIVHSEIDQDNIPGAYIHASRLEPDARNVIPKKVWNWMSNVHADSK